MLNTKALLNNATRTGLIGTALVGLACSLTLELDTAKSCESELDCVYSNGQGVCDQGLCRPPGSPSATTATSGTAPLTTGVVLTGADPTTDSNDSTGVTTGETDTTGPLGCTRNTDCTSDERCGDTGLCISLLSAECQILQYPNDVDRDNVVFVGTIYPTGGSFSTIVQPIENATQLAIEDFNGTTSLQGDRQIAWVGCDSTAGTDAALAATQHLVDNVGVPAIVGPVFSESVLAAAQQITIEAGVFIMTPTATATSITEIEDNDLIWRTIPPDTYQANAIVDRMVNLTSDPTMPLSRLLVLHKDDAYGNGLRAGVEDALAAALPGVEIFYRSYANPAEFDNQDDLLAAYGIVLAAVDGTLPIAGQYFTLEDHYTDVLVLGTSEMQAFLYKYIEVVWASRQVALPALSPPLPRFTSSHGAVPDLPRFVSEIGPATDTAGLLPLADLIRIRLEGVSPVIFDAVNFASFNVRYRIRFNNQDALSSSSLGYDAMLSTLFAMCTVPGDTKITGALIADGMPRLKDPAGTAISFSGQTLAFLTEARNALVIDDGSVDLRGVSGELEWDDEGEIRANMLGWNLIDNDAGPDIDPALSVTRSYLLNTAPAEDGTWSDL